jgi:hypothetical protein
MRVIPPFLTITNNEFLFECELQEIMDEMFAKMDQMKTNQSSHVENNHEGTTGKCTIPSSMDFMMEKNILIGRWLSNNPLCA